MVLLIFFNRIRPFVLALNPWNKEKNIVHDEHYLSEYKK